MTVISSLFYVSRLGQLRRRKGLPPLAVPDQRVRQEAVFCDIEQRARAIRASGRPDARVPIIAMTANSFKEDEEAARAAGMDGFVPKPIDVAYLLSVLRQYTV